MTGHRCAECGSTTQPFEHETFTVAYDGAVSQVADLSGWRCGSCGEVAFEPDSAARYAAAGDALIVQARARQAKDLTRIRTRLGLTQEGAALLTGGGHNAFSRYERGEVPPMPAVLNLFKLLDRHPDLLAELETRGAARPGRPKATPRASGHGTLPG